MGVWSGRVLPFLASYIWSFSIPQSMSAGSDFPAVNGELPAASSVINLLEGCGNDNPGAKSTGFSRQ
jgi:hypothetical protein